jgi:2-alkyl-3-oxoalkanoate reductase
MPSRPEPAGGVLVTGATGFLGSAVVGECLARGFCVRGVGRRSGKVPNGVSFFPMDLRGPVGLEGICEGVNAVIHAAGLAHRPEETKWEEFFENNVSATANVMAAARAAGVARVVLVSSVAVYGRQEESPIEESAQARPDSLYAKSKHLAEQEAMRIAADGRLRLVILRLATIYGEEDPGNVARLIRAIDRKRFVWVGHGGNRKSLIHRQDAARACVEALGVPGAGCAVYNVTGPPITMKEIVTEAADALGRRLPSWRVPAGPARAALRLAGRLPFLGRKASRASTTLEKWLSEEVFSAERFRAATRFESRVSLREGLRREVAWYRGAR